MRKMRASPGAGRVATTVALVLLLAMSPMRLRAYRARSTGTLGSTRHATRPTSKR